MDNNMYKLVQDAIKSGRSVEDLVAEIRQTADTVRATTPNVKEDILNHFKMNGLIACGIANEHGMIDTDQLVDVIAAWMVQNGFDPDGVVEDRNEVVDAVKELLNSDLSICKTGARLVKGPANMSIESLLKGLLGGPTRPVIKDFNMKH